jgi:hypothetical protein
VKAVTDYVTRRLVERARALADPDFIGRAPCLAAPWRRRGWRGLALFLLGFVLGVLALGFAAFLLASRP